jgi:hypothetical protein
MHKDIPVAFARAVGNHLREIVGEITAHERVALLAAFQEGLEEEPKNRFATTWIPFPVRCDGALMAPSRDEGNIVYVLAGARETFNLTLGRANSDPEGTHYMDSKMQIYRQGANWEVHTTDPDGSDAHVGDFVGHKGFKANPRIG